jgi:hypothetical protein
MKQRNDESQAFDFDLGYLVQSPCKGCSSYRIFPECMDNCKTLDRVQSMLCESVSSAHNFSSMETFELPLEVLDQI